MPPSTQATIQSYGRRFPILLSTPSPRGQVELLETIGKGNYGYVYKWTHSEGQGRLLKQGNKLTAVKVVYLKEDELKETLLEMEILKSCSQKNITGFMGSFLKGLDFWICMEYCSGGALDTLYNSFRNPLSEETLACILYETLQALDYLHSEAGLIHRDIKAGNLLLTEDGQLKLADFGVSAKLDAPGQTAQTFIGTPYWMAPEVISLDPETNTNPDLAYNSKADIWSLGITAIEIAEKNPPLSDIHPMRALQLIPKSDLGFAKPKNWSKSFVDFVGQCLTKDPKKRPSAADMLSHPFVNKAQDWKREVILKDLVIKARIARERKRQGKEGDDEDEPSEKNESIPAKVIAETMKQARQAQETISEPTGILPVKKHMTMLRSSSNDVLPLSKMKLDDLPEVNNTVFGQNPVLEIKAIGTLYKSEIVTADFLDGQYLLMGGSKGLCFIDVKSDASKPHLLIGATSFSQILVLEDYSVLLAIAGKHSHIRQYKLSSIRKLIRFLTGGNAQELAQMDLSSPIVPEPSSGQEDEEEYKSLRDLSNNNDTALVTQWSTDYIKIPGTRDTKEVFVQRTATSIFMLALVRQDLILHQWAAEPYSKFMKLKAFWLPEKPKFVNLFHDGIMIREICLGYRNEANLVIVEDSKVVDIFTHREFAVENWKARWRTFNQIPFSAAKERELKEFSSTVTTVNRKLLAASGPTLKRPMNIEVDRFFLATYDRLTRVTDIQGQPLIGSGAGGWTDGVTWNESLNTAILRPMENVIGVSDSAIQVFDWNTAKCQQTAIFPNSILKVLSQRVGGVLVLAERKRSAPVLYWLKEQAEPEIRKVNVLKPSVKILSPSMANLHLDEKSGLGFGMRDVNAVNNSNPVSDYRSQHLAFQGGSRPTASSPSASPASSRGNTPPMSTDEYIRMRSKQQFQQFQPIPVAARPFSIQSQYPSSPAQPISFQMQPRPLQIRPYSGHSLTRMYSPSAAQPLNGSPMIDSMNSSVGQFVRSPMRHSAYFSDVDLSGMRPTQVQLTPNTQVQPRPSPEPRQPAQTLSTPQGQSRPAVSPNIYYSTPGLARQSVVQPLPPPAFNSSSAPLPQTQQPGIPFQALAPQPATYHAHALSIQQTRIIQPGQPIMYHQRPQQGGQIGWPQNMSQGNLSLPNGQRPPQRPLPDPPSQPNPSSTPPQ